ncbi:hypothetical protein GY03_00950 [Proteus vulgaris]|uniref:hypothetical protein n=1 Tax=Proteus vulgaris TaxID=585 RepID=UPI0021B0E51A|nr:hypothetical protein [Proteus vulgaris]MCT6515859.1 hypothetical protein [Proteus vulgaris]
MSDFLIFFYNSIVGLFLGCVASIITAQIALKKFYKEKWWERKYQAYNNLIDSLIEVKYIYGKASEHFQNIHEKENGINYIENHDYSFDWDNISELGIIIRRLYIIAPISLSENVKKLLDDYFKLTENTGYIIYVENYPNFLAYSELEKDIQLIIDFIIEDARKELKFK